VGADAVKDTLTISAPGVKQAGKYEIVVMGQNENGETAEVWRYTFSCSLAGWQILNLSEEREEDGGYKSSSLLSRDACGFGGYLERPIQQNIAPQASLPFLRRAATVRLGSRISGWKVFFPINPPSLRFPAD